MLMKKKVLLLTGASLLLGLSMNAQTQDVIWTMDFNSGTDMFNESKEASHANVLPGITFYGGLTKSEEDSNSKIKYDGIKDKPKVFIDTLLQLTHNIAPMTDEDANGRHDDYAFIKTTPEDDAEFSKLGFVSDGGDNLYLSYHASASTKNYSTNMWSPDPAGQVNDYQANLFVRSLPIEENTSYRISYYMRVDSITSFLDVRLLRGWYDSEKPFAMENGKDNFIQEVKGSSWINTLADGSKDTILKGNAGVWKRYTFMTYYKDAELLNKICQDNWYWSDDSRKPWNVYFQALKYKLSPEQLELFHKTWKEAGDTIYQRDEQGEIMYDEESGEAIVLGIDSITIDTTYSLRVVQPADFFLRFAFRGPSATYDVDNIALYKSTIGAAEYGTSNNIIRINFGYETNIADLCKNSAIGRISVPVEQFEVSYVKDGVRKTAPLITAEYQKDGMVYLWMGDEDEDFNFDSKMSDMRVSFKNSKDIAFQMKYTGKLYPFFEDKAWVDAGMIVKDFENELLLPCDFAVVPNMLDLPPSMLESTPEDKSFGLGNDTRDITIALTRKAYIGKLDDGDAPIIANIYGGNGAAAIDEAAAAKVTINNEESDSLINITISKKDYPTLDGTYFIELHNLRADYGDGTYSQFTEVDVEGEVKAEFTFGDPAQAVLVKGSSAAVCYNQISTAYKKDTTYISENDADKESAPMKNFISIVSQFNPDEFIKTHGAPSEYAAAAKVLEDALTVVKAAKVYVNLIADAETALANGAALNTTEAYAALDAAIKAAKSFDLSTATNEAILAQCQALKRPVDKLNAVPSLKAQADALVALINTLGGSIDADLQKLYSKVEDDDVYLVEMLKLAATKAIYAKLAKGESIDSVDATGFINNPEFYMTGVLDEEIESYTAQYHGNVTAYRVKEEKTFDTVYPSWTLWNQISTGFFGKNNMFGFWSTRSIDWKLSPESTADDTYNGDYNIVKGDVMPGVVACDWGVSFKVNTTVKGLPAGKYTLVAPVRYSAKNEVKNDLLIFNDTLKYSKADSVMVQTTLTEAGDAYLELNHNSCNSSVNLQHFKLYLQATKDASANYEQMISDIEKKMGEIKTKVAPVATKGGATYYNMSGIKVNALRPGEVGIRVQDGVSETVLGE